VPDWRDEGSHNSVDFGTVQTQVGISEKVIACYARHLFETKTDSISLQENVPPHNDRSSSHGDRLTNGAPTLNRDFKKDWTDFVPGTCF